MKTAVLEVKLSDVAKEYLAASADLLEAVWHADRALMTDEVLAKAEALLAIVDDHRGDL